MRKTDHLSYDELQARYEEAYTMLMTLLDNIPGGVFSYFAETGKFDFVGDGLLSIFHCDEDTFREHFYDSFELMILKADRKNTKEQLEEQIRFFDSAELTYRVQDFMNEGQIIWLNHRARLLRGSDGKERYIVVVSDITDQRLIQDEVQRMNKMLYIETERYKLIEAVIEETQFDFDVRADKVMYSIRNNAGEPQEIEQFMQNNQARHIVHPEDYNRVNVHLVKALLEPIKSEVDYRSKNLTGEYVWYRMTYASLADENGVITRVVGIMKDITDEHAAQEAINQELKLDQMTGILNKMSTQEAIEEYLTICHAEQKSKQALFALDTDNFKAVNDTLGHQFGDDVIRFVAKTLRGAFKESDIVGRTGGDEFMVLMKNTSPAVVEERAHELNRLMTRTFTKDGKAVSITCSIGIAYFSAEAAHYAEMFARADQALYCAKESGKNCFRIYGDKQ
ncbi:MAG: diguanylate cyclase [bacterium]|nr:diguanylate cyclase [bacterium]